MQELRRTLFNQRRMLLLFILLAANLLWLHTACGPSLQNGTRSTLKGQLEQFSGLSLEECRNQLDSLYQELDWLEAMEYGQINTQIDHLLNYDSYVQEILDQAERMASVSIFADSDYSRENVRKTAADYRQMIDTELTLGNDLPVQWMVYHQGGGWLAAVFILLVLWSFLEERKPGLWNVVCSSPKGRRQLSQTRLLTTASAAVVAGTMFTVTELLYCYGAWGGWDELDRTAQSVSLFNNLTIPMTLGELWIVYLGLRIAGLLGIALAAWLLMELVADRRLIPAVWAAVLGISWLLRNLPKEHLLYHANLLLWMQPVELLMSYNNLNIMGRPVGQLTVFLISVSIMVPQAAIGTAVIYERRKPVVSYRWLDTLLERFASLTARLGLHVSLFSHEIYRIMTTGRGWRVLAVAAIAVILTAAPSVSSGGQTGKYLESYYRQSQGPVNADTQQYLLEQQKRLTAEYEARDQLEADFHAGLITEEEYSGRMMAYQKLDEQEFALEQYRSHLERLQECEGSYILPHWVLEKLLGVSGEETARIQLISSVAIVLLFAGIAGIERRTGMLRSRRASARGRKDIRLHRHGAAWLICAVFGGGLWGLYFGLLWMDYESIPWLDAPVRCLSFMEQKYGNLSVLGYYLLQTEMRTLWLCLLASLILTASEVRDTYET